MDSQPSAPCNPWGVAQVQTVPRRWCPEKLPSFDLEIHEDDRDLSRPRILGIPKEWPSAVKKQLQRTWRSLGEPSIPWLLPRTHKWRIEAFMECTFLSFFLTDAFDFVTKPQTWSDSWHPPLHVIIHEPYTTAPVLFTLKPLPHCWVICTLTLQVVSRPHSSQWNSFCDPSRNKRPHHGLFIMFRLGVAQVARQGGAR